MSFRSIKLSSNKSSGLILSMVSIASIGVNPKVSALVSGNIEAEDEVGAWDISSVASGVKSSLRSPTSREISVLEDGRKLSRKEVKSGRLALSRSHENCSFLEKRGLGGLVTDREWVSGVRGWCW